MITYQDGLFVLETRHTSYLFACLSTGQLEHLHYGGKIDPAGAMEALGHKCVNLNGCSVAYAKDAPTLGLDDICLEVSGLGKGDYRQPFAELTLADGSRTTDFIYQGYEIVEGAATLAALPSAYGAEAQHLKLFLQDRHAPITLELCYTVFEACDVIVRSAAITNEGSAPIRIDRLMSAQLDMEGADHLFHTFTGDWVREMNHTVTPVKAGCVQSSSRSGHSSNHANPFVMVSRPGTTEIAGECYASNLIYSGNHLEAVEVSGHGKTRFITGIHPEGFSWRLWPGERFQAPQAALTFSSTGFEGISYNMHRFVREHIVRGEWQHKERPILLNSWEAAYFGINENKLLRLAKAGKDVGIELFVMDDGWFGKRDNDTCSLGDWTPNPKKLPGGLSSLCQKVQALGMAFGLWVEPEMVNEDSELYRAHPDWAVQVPGRDPSTGRNQMLLDLTRPEVRENIIAQMTAVFSSCALTYVKWDMNRPFTDLYSPTLEADDQGEFAHRYVLGLYEVMGTLVKRFPHILFEGCASGGNRFDLGILSFFPQIWASDNSDAISRVTIQTGYSYGYPPSVIGAHVSGCPNHQTLRQAPLDTRFSVAAFGLLGYECNLCELSAEDLSEIREQISLYKKWRKVLQYGDFHRLEAGSQLAKWLTVAPDKSQAVGMMVQGLVVPNMPYADFRTRGLDDTKRYRFQNRPLKHNVLRFGDLINTISPVHIKKDSLVHHAVAHFVKMDGEKESYTVSGSLLNQAGIRLAQGFVGVGYAPNTRLYQDFDSRMYLMEEATTPLLPEATATND